MFLENIVVVQLPQKTLVFSRITVGLSDWCHNVHAVGLSHVFITHSSEYVIFLGAGVPNIYTVNRIHFDEL